MKLEPLGDQAVIAYCDNEQQAVALAAQVRAANPAWLVDVVQAYVSVAIYYDLATADFFAVADWLTRTIRADDLAVGQTVGRSHVVPCCYEWGLDLERIEKHTGLTNDAIIDLHTQTIYTVYAIGFCPGFPYLGYLPPELTGVPRLESPRLSVEAGSVGLTGRQTGVYTETRPGGWNIVGRTPLELVHVQDGYFPLRTGDTVQFRRIDEAEYRALCGQRLT
jgi:inhibitor of KinA